MKDEPLCDTCVTKEIETGILICKKCDRWYPLIDEIPHMFPDDLRDKKDVFFLEKFKGLMSRSVLKSGGFFNLG